MHGSGVDINHVTGLYRYPVEQLLHVLGVNRGLDLSAVYPGPETKPDTGAGRGAERIPAFGLAARQAYFSGALIIRVHLHREPVLGKKDLDQKRKAKIPSQGSVQFTSKLLSQFGQRAPLEIAIGNTAAFPGEPHLTDGLLAHSVGRVESAEVA